MWSRSTSTQTDNPVGLQAGSFAALKNAHGEELQKASILHSSHLHNQAICSAGELHRMPTQSRYSYSSVPSCPSCSSGTDGVLYFKILLGILTPTLI